MFTFKNVALIIAIAAIYYAAGTFGLLFAVEGTSATPLWPPAGIAVAAVCGFGWRVWPGIFLGAIIANIVHFAHMPAFAVSAILVASTGIAVGNSLEAVLACVLCKRWIGDNPLDDVQGVFKFVPIVALACMVSSVIGTGTMLTLGLENTANAWLIFVTWWLGDTLAVIIIAPLLLSWWPLGRFPRREKLLELGFAFATLILVCQVIFVRHYDLVVLNSQPVLAVPVLTWLALRFSRREVVTGVALLCLFAVYATTRNQGPFAAETLTRSFLSEQLFSAVVAITMLALSATVAKSARFQEKLQQANEELEQRVAKRTEEIEKKTRVLEAINHQLRIEAEGRISAETQLRNLLQHKRT